ncbi:hypothetical protein EXN66_Car000027 [Channa argus]|uniref:Uncharacterized protein n=2 Tax=Channa argus TaxID=215402 RepID=A0A6G1QWJ2_CHAAH|nr:hypothetical protein EXN66_Car000027 [Channa argus]
MNQCEDREEGVPPSKTTLCGGHESQTKDQRMKKQRPDSTEPICTSMKSDWSAGRFIDFKVAQPAHGRMKKQRPDSADPSWVSMKSDWSAGRIIDFKDEQPAHGR